MESPPCRANHLPDKEFRYLRHACYSASLLDVACVARSFLPDSSCRHEDRTVSSRLERRELKCAWRAVSEDPAGCGFLLIVRTGWIFTAHCPILCRGCDTERVPPDTRRFQHIARFNNGL